MNRSFNGKIVPSFVVLLILASVCLADASPASAPASQPATAGADWPQWRGPNRDGVAPSSPRLLDSWPKEGPPLLWKSDWIPGCEEGGCSHPVVADGKVFVYANAKRPVDGGNGFRFVTTELLIDAGWLPGLPEDLAKKIEGAWASPDRPSSSGWEWYNPERSRKNGELDAFLAKKPKLDKYIKDFIATLRPEDASKYGAYVRRRLCIDTPKNKWGVANGLSWDVLVTMSKLRNTRHRSRRKWGAELRQISHDAVSLCENYPKYYAWRRVYTMSDTVFCLDARTGKTIWRKDFPEDWAVTKNTRRVQWWCFDSLGACGTPAVWGGKCYVAGAMGLYCFSVKDGALLWQVKGEPVHSSVVVADGVIYDGGQGRAYDAENGKLLWKNPLWPKGRWPVKDDMYRWNAPLLWATGGKNYIITTDGGVSSYCCLDMETGKVLWTLKTRIGLFTTVRGDILIAPSPYGGRGTKAYKMTLAGAELLWKKGFSGSWGDIIYQDHLYLLDRCVDLKTGEVNWKSRIGIDTMCPLVLADGKIISPLGSSHQITKRWGGGYSVVMFKATPEKYVQLGLFNPHACHMSSPAFAGGKLYVRLLDSVACYDLREHGIYLDGVTAGKGSLTFRFKQTGGGLAAKDAANGVLKDVLITGAAGAAKPAKAKIDGDNIVVDIKDAAVPFSISYAGAGALTGKNGLPLPAFGWNAGRVLKHRKCFDNKIVLVSDLYLGQDGNWDKAETFAVAGAKITRVEVDPTGKGVSLATDKTWKPGDAVTLTYACFPVEQGEPRRETLTFTVAEPQRAAARLVKTDATTSGNWKGIYGAAGAIIVGDKASSAPQYAIVTPANKEDKIPWAPNAADVRYLQKLGEAKGRTVTSWHAPDQFDIGIELTDGKEHQVAVYCMDWGSKSVMTVEVLDADTRAVLDTQTVNAFNKGKYLVWNFKGQVTLRFVNTIQEEGTAALVSGVFFDAPAQPAK